MTVRVDAGRCPFNKRVLPTLTSLHIQNAKPREKPYKLSDGSGLHLSIEPGGGKLWRFRYRFSGKEKMLSLGAFPEVLLAAAREKRDEARKLLASGIDPSAQKKQDKITAAIAANNTFGLIAQEHLDTLKASGAAPKTMAKMRWLLLDLSAPLSERPAAEITSAKFSRFSNRSRKAEGAKPPGGSGAPYRLAVRAS